MPVPPVVWTNIFVLLVLAVVFQVMRAYGNRPVTTFWYSVGFFLGSLAWFSSVLRPFFAEHGLLIANGLFFGSAASLLIGASRWRQVAIPMKFIAIVGLLTFPAGCWFLYVDYNTEYRIALLSVSITLMFAGVARTLLKSPSPGIRGFSPMVATGMFAALNAVAVVTQLPIHLYGPGLPDFLDISVGTFVLLVVKPALLVGLGIFLMLGLVVDNINQLRELTVFDPVTRLLNAQGFDRQVAFDLARHRRDGQQFAVILADLDHFTRIEETFEREVASAAMLRFADVLRGVVRASVPVARLGDGRFAILVEDSGGEQAAAVAERARIQLHSVELEETDPVFPLRGSFGVAPVIDIEQGITPALEEAERNLLKSVARGGDRVTVPGQPEDGQG